MGASYTWKFRNKGDIVTTSCSSLLTAKVIYVTDGISQVRIGPKGTRGKRTKLRLRETRSILEKGDA